MTWLRLAISNLRLSALASLVVVVLLALSTASIILLLLASTQLEETLVKDAKGIDLVLGASGSPVQLVLSSVYHADIPTGNISHNDANLWANDSRVALAAPLSIGDNYRGYRIVGTTHDYLEFFGARLGTGQLWDHPMEAIVGATVAESTELTIGSSVTGVHGLSASAHKHDAKAYKVVGILAPTGTVIDRLILSSLESVWQLHNDGPESDHEAGKEAPQKTHDHENHLPSDGHSAGADKQITAMLLRYASPLSALSFPREVNASSKVQAAVPAMEMARVLQLTGAGLDGLRGLAWILIFTAFLSLFATLYGSLRSRRRDLAMLRCLGANRWELFLSLILEGLLLASSGLACGIAVGHGVMEFSAQWLNSVRGSEFTGWIWLGSEALLIIGLLVAATLAAALPAIQAYQTDVAGTLSAP